MIIMSLNNGEEWQVSDDDGDDDDDDDVDDDDDDDDGDVDDDDDGDSDGDDRWQNVRCRRSVMIISNCLRRGQ